MSGINEAYATYLIITIIISFYSLRLLKKNSNAIHSIEKISKFVIKEDEE